MSGGGRAGPPRAEAATVGLALFLGAALAAGLFDGAPPWRMAAQADSAEPAPPAAARLCFRGPGGEALDFSSAAHHCPRQAAADAGPRAVAVAAGASWR